MLQVLRPMTEPEYVCWLEAAIPAYAVGKVALSRWPEQDAIERARKEYAQLLPAGLATENNLFFAVLDDSGKNVGSLWFAEAPRVGFKVAYVFDIVIYPVHRRQGHASRALKALEVEATRRGLAGIALHVLGQNIDARALYSKLGFEPTNINLYKPLSAPTQSDA